MRNMVKEIREDLLLSREELARRAGVSSGAVDRIEKGGECRMDTKRRIILALGCDFGDRDRIFKED